MASLQGSQSTLLRSTSRIESQPNCSSLLRRFGCMSPRNRWRSSGRRRWGRWQRRRMTRRHVPLRRHLPTFRFAEIEVLVVFSSPSGVSCMYLFCVVRVCCSSSLSLEAMTLLDITKLALGGFANRILKIKNNYPFFLVTKKTITL